MVELSVLSEREKELQAELRHTQDLLREEKNRSQRYLDQVSVYYVYTAICSSRGQRQWLISKDLCQKEGDITG